MNELLLPSNLIQGTQWDPDPRRSDWLKRLPSIVSDLTQRWDLELGDPYEPGGQCSWVAPARTRAGEALVLKVGWRHAEALYEADGLKFWDGNGVVRVHADHMLDDTIALLLERCEPGTGLCRLPEADQDVVVCGLLPRLWREPADEHEFPSLHDMCNDWADGYQEKVAREGSQLDPGIARVGLELFRTLPASADRRVMLATDLHAENILAAQREVWLLIDPKPHVGDPVYDVLQHMLNCDRLFTEPVGLANRLASMLDLDPARLLAWLFARCVQESPGWPGMAEVATRLAP